MQKIKKLFINEKLKTKTISHVLSDLAPLTVGCQFGWTKLLLLCVIFKFTHFQIS